MRNLDLVIESLRGPIDWRFKSFPASDEDVSGEDIAAHGWNALAGDFAMPVLVIKRDAVDHNLRVMRDYCEDHGVDLAPHAKTSMAPQLLARHVDAGAWGFTVATISQARVLQAFGFTRLILASQLVEPSAVRWLSAAMDADDSFDVVSLVDSLQGVAIMEEALAARSARRPLRVLVEVGQAGGRTGCRTTEDAIAVAEAIRATPTLELAGVEGFEGLIDAGSPAATMAAVNDFLAAMHRLVVRLDELGMFDHLAEVIVSAGGSAFFDRVVGHLTGWNLRRPVRTILRSGCYATHDDEMYEVVSPLAARSQGEPRLLPALEVWGAVWSRPEPELAIVGMGKRDAAYDYGLPLATAVRSPDGRQRCVRDRFAVTGLNDQHGYIRVPAEDPLAPGDLVAFGISHPCAAFDKWRLIPVVDDSYMVVDAFHTFF